MFMQTVLLEFLYEAISTLAIQSFSSLVTSYINQLKKKVVRSFKRID